MFKVMGAGVLFGAIIGLLILIVAPISYIILKYFGYKKTGIIVALLLASIVIIPFCLIYFESELYSKSDARKDLNKLGIELKDEFNITSNEIIGTSDYYQFTKLKISSTDKNSIIQKIKNAKNFKIIYTSEMSLEDSIYKYNLHETNSKITFSKNYNLGNKYVIEYFEKQFDFVPTKIKIEVDKLSDTIKLERIEDY